MSVQLCKNELTELLDYFNETYVSGTYRMVQPPPNNDGVNLPMCKRCVPPIFPPVIWNVRDITINKEDRTKNICKAWNIGYQKLVGHKHPSFWTSIEYIRKDEALASASIIQYSVYYGSYPYTTKTSSNNFYNYIYNENSHAQTFIR